MGFPGTLSGKESACQCRRPRFDPCIGKIPWRRKWQLTPGFSPGKSHGQWSLAGCSLWGHKRVRHDLVPPAVPGLAVSAAHGAGSGGGNVNKSGFYSYLTLECRVHLLSARYQTPAAPNRVFTKAACANCVAETRASDTTLR